MLTKKRISLIGLTIIASTVFSVSGFASQRETAQLANLQAKIEKLNFASKAKIIADINKAIEHNDNGINFLSMQLNEGVMLLSAVDNGAKTANSILDNMRVLAVQSQNGANSTDDLKRLNKSYQIIKSSLNNIHVDLYNGEKKVSGGAVTIKFGDQTGDENSITIPVPAFDLAGLGLENSHIDAMDDARLAYNAIDAALSIVNSVPSIENIPSIESEKLLMAMPLILKNYFDLVQVVSDLAITSASGITSAEERLNLDTVFAYVKQEMLDNQSYHFLSKNINIGGGDVHIQIGNQATPDSTLNIAVPVIDIALTNLDKCDIKTKAGALMTLDVLAKIKHDFVYGTQRKS